MSIGGLVLFVVIVAWLVMADVYISEKMITTIFFIVLIGILLLVGSRQVKVPASTDTRFKEIRGIGGQLTLLDNKIRISRRGTYAFICHGLKGDKEILIKQISAIQFKKAGMTSGYIQFVFIGSQESKAGIFGAVNDENTVVFNASQQKNFEEFKNAVEEKMNVLDGQQSSAGIGDLEKLADLKQKGIITEEEFVLKKRKILNL